MNSVYKPRLLTATVETRLRRFPVVIVTGARQTGKSVLVKDLVGGPARSMLTLDDLDTLERVRREPEAMAAGIGRASIDGIQRNPEFLLAIKRAVDRRRTPGRFLISGSANLALMRRVSESLAGKAVYLVLHPMTVAERAGAGTAGRWSELVRKPAGLRGEYEPLADLDRILLRGGFPTSALAGRAFDARAWFEEYMLTYLERDLRELSAIDNLPDFRRLMRIAALRSGSLLNQSEIGRDAGLPQATAHRYLGLAKTSHLLNLLPPYSVNRTRRLVKTPKVFYADTGLAAHLAGIESPADLDRSGLRGALLETLVLGDLLAWRETVTPRPEILFWRTAAGEEVDFVVEWKGLLTPVEVKCSARVRPDDVRHLKTFLAEYGHASTDAVVLYQGDQCGPVADRVWAVPLPAALGVTP
jgi:hypothetical protein